MTNLDQHPSKVNTPAANLAAASQQDLADLDQLLAEAEADTVTVIDSDPSCPAQPVDDDPDTARAEQAPLPLEELAIPQQPPDESFPEVEPAAPAAAPLQQDLAKLVEEARPAGTVMNGDTPPPAQPVDDPDTVPVEKPAILHRSPDELLEDDPAPPEILDPTDFLEPDSHTLHTSSFGILPRAALDYILPHLWGGRVPPRPLRLLIEILSRTPVELRKNAQAGGIWLGVSVDDLMEMLWPRTKARGQRQRAQLVDAVADLAEFCVVDEAAALAAVRDRPGATPDPADRPDAVFPLRGTIPILGEQAVFEFRWPESWPVGGAKVPLRTLRSTGCASVYDYGIFLLSCQDANALPKDRQGNIWPMQPQVMCNAQGEPLDRKGKVIPHTATRSPRYSLQAVRVGDGWERKPAEFFREIPSRTTEQLLVELRTPDKSFYARRKMRARVSRSIQGLVAEGLLTVTTRPGPRGSTFYRLEPANSWGAWDEMPTSTRGLKSPAAVTDPAPAATVDCQTVPVPAPRTRAPTRPGHGAPAPPPA